MEAEDDLRVVVTTRNPYWLFNVSRSYVQRSKVEPRGDDRGTGRKPDLIGGDRVR